MIDSLTIIDLSLLAIFVIFMFVFLKTRKHNLKKEGLLFLYKTSWGIKLINYIGTKYKKTIGVLSYVSVFMGYVLMVGGIYLIYTIVKVYLFNPSIVRAIKVPPIIPLVPYLPQVFKLDFLPPFYFTYWIVILAIIAITHEMAHGIFAVYEKVKVKTTGFGFFPWFFPIFLAAFVELDEKKMAKKKKFPQLAILSAGTFANVITAIIFLFLLFGFFALAFSPSGVIFDSYSTSTIAVSGISMINGISVNNASYQDMIDSTNGNGLSELRVGSQTYLTTKEMLENQIDNEGLILVYSDSPAVRANLSSIITAINGVPLDGIAKLQQELGKYQPGDNVTITEKTNDGFSEKMLTLGNNPSRPGTAWIGIGFFSRNSNSFFGKLTNEIASFKDSNVYYAPKFGGFSIFIYNLLWWIVIISISVALINMLPVGIFDGGRFFYLTVLGLTKSEKIARRAFAFTTYLFLFVLLLLMVFWVFSF